MDDNRVNNFGDIVYSCLIPYDMHWEHRQPNHSIVFVRSGKLVIDRDGERQEISAGNYVFVRRDCKVNITKSSLRDEAYSGINISLNRDALKECFHEHYAGRRLPKDARPITETALLLPATTAMKGLFQSLIPYVDSNEQPSEATLRLKLQEAILCLLDINRDFFPTLFDFNEEWKVDILDFMEHNFTEDMTLEEFAHYTGRSLATFKRDFAKVSDVTPQRWLTVHRLERARQLLEQGDITVADACYKVGFKNRSHFSTAYKQMFGITPGNRAC